MGWGGVKKEGESELNNDLDLFYQTFFAHDHRLKFIFPINEPFDLKNGDRIYFIDPLSGAEVYDTADEAAGILVYEPNNINKYHKSHNDCPFCSSKNSLTILGSRAASLTSVLIGQSFASGYNDDKKLITFSDSVQDAAHRAGFFAARSYQFTLRSALQQALIAHGEDVPLPEFAKLIASYWRKQLVSDEQYVATMIAPDMEWLQDYEALQKKNKLPMGSDIAHLINERIDWSVYSEYGYKSNIGRTLERTAASVAYIAELDHVVEDVLPRLQNEIEMLRDISAEQLHKFIFVLLLHMKKQGAIFTSHLGTYVSSGGNIFAFTKYQQRYMPSFTKRSRSPEFLTTGSFKTLEKIHNKTNTSWCDQWILDNFLDDNLLISGYATVVYRVVLETLLKHKVILEEESSEYPIWGLNAEKISITNNVSKLKCDTCRNVLIVKEGQDEYAKGMCCLRKGCQGHYLHASQDEDYYRDLYSYGDLQRIVAEEHTGLLEREQREWVENSFIGREKDEPWKPNLLSATPTLEMGIDIGDLSSVILCSVPPNGANYLQRIGRAGRTDGNAFNATVANARDHDLYFYSDPDALMQGTIDAPGVFLDASAILQRQFLAFCIDQWVSEKKVKEIDLPYRLSIVLDAVVAKQKSKFPFTLIDYIQHDADNLLEQFFSLYEDDLQTITKEQIKLFAKGSDVDVREKDEPDELKESMSLAYKILNRLEQVIIERNAIEKSIGVMRDKIKVHQKAKAKDKDHEDVLREYNSELEGLKSVLRVIKKKDTFEFFTNEGLLPNYAFPESGVILKSVIFRRKQQVQDEDGAGYESFTLEYERSGSSAISELAPHNSFYASGRKVTVDQIDMNVSEVESWRFCDQCSYSERDSSIVESQCPKCGSTMWSDAGQKRDLIRMKQVMANTNDRASRLKDDSDQRDPTFYTKQLLITFDKDQVQDAYAIKSEETPFGFEFIQKANFKEINFGQSSLNGEEVDIAGKRMPRLGFVICKHCGKVQDHNPKDDYFSAKHAFSCESTDPSAEDNFVESLYLYREFSSEAIRLLLPITTMAISDEKLHSLIAAFQMGLKIHFKGSVDHLRVSVYDEIEEDEEFKRRYLMLYDTVPGGTGYLRQLMRDGKPLFEVLQKAYKRLMTCSCNDDHTKDGCYQCLYAYKNNFDRPLISREKAKDIISNILKYEEEIKKVKGLGKVSVNQLIESELEAKFLEEIDNYIRSQYQVKMKPIITSRERTGFLVKFGKNNYELEQQVNLDEKEGVSIASRADFVFYPLGNKALKPIVVFTDGYTYHRDSIAKDSAQRMALVASNKYIVWSLTWEDVDQFSQKKPKYGFSNYLSEEYMNMNSFTGLQKQNRVFIKNTSFQWLVELLETQDTAEWKNRAIHSAISMTSGKRVKRDSSEWEDIISVLTEDMLDVFPYASDYLVGNKKHDNLSISVMSNVEEVKKRNISNTAAILSLDDARVVPMNIWAGVLRLFNLFQFLNYGFFTTASGVNNRAYDLLKYNIKIETDKSSIWSAVYEDVQDEVKSLVKLLSKEGLPIPEVGYELCDEKGMIVAECELAWVQKEIAVVIDDPIEIDGWKVFTIGESEAIIESIKQKVKA
jgi:DEAD/DEAH box helicase domain-containing protein